MQLTFTCNHEPSILDNTFIKSAPLKSILLNYSIWWFIHSFRKKLARRNDAQIPKYVCQVLNLFIKGYPVNSFSSLHQLVHQKPCHRIQGSRPNTRRCLALYLQFTGPNFCCFNLALNYISSQFRKTSFIYPKYDNDTCVYHCWSTCTSFTSWGSCISKHP